MNNLGQGRFKGYSAGSHPGGSVNPYALELLARHQFSTENLHSKSWDVFSQPDAPQFDFIFTVCDNAAGEACPFWPGKPISAHWGVEDPAAVEGSKEAKTKAFSDVFRILSRRISLFLSLPLDKLDALAIKQEMDQIGLVREARV